MRGTGDLEDGHVLEGVVRRSSLPVVLVDLVRLRFVVGSPSATEMLGQLELAGLELSATLAESDATRSALGLLRSGTVDAYEAHRVFVDARGEERLLTLWVRGLAQRGFRDWALTILKPTDDTHVHWAGDTQSGGLRSGLAVGTGDIEGGIDRVSSEIEDLLGIASSEFCAQPLYSWVHPSEAQALEAALQRSRDTGGPEVLTARLRTSDGGWTVVRIVVMVGAPRRGSRVGVAILRDGGVDPAGDADASVAGLTEEIRALDLVEAMTHLPASTDLPDVVEELTEREWEIVARLLRGDRVPAIAEAVYLAPSTVRNHLAAVFRKVGVNSQQELITHLRGDRRS